MIQKKGLTKYDISGLTAVLTTGGGFVSYLFNQKEWTNGSILAGLTITLSVVYLLWRRKAAQKRNVLDFKSHPFFSNMRYYLDQRIPRFRVDCPLRTTLLRITMRSKFEAGLKHVEHFVFQEKTKDINTMKTMVTDIINSYEKEWERLHIPVIFIDKFYLFHKPKMNRLIDFIEQVSASSLLGIDGKVVALLYALQTAYDSTLLDLEKANSEINGELSEELKRLRASGLF